MEKIRRELGPEAVILSSRNIRGKGFGGLFKKKLLEVVVAHEPFQEKARAEQKQKQQADLPLRDLTPIADFTKIDQLNEKLCALQDAVKDFTDKITTAEKESTLMFTPDVAGLYNKLVLNDVQDELAKRISTDAQSISDKLSEDPRLITEQLIYQVMGDPAQIKLKKYKTNIIMLVGPTGVGKTTTLVKMAGLYSGSYGLKVGLINTDTYRVAAQEQLKTYSEIMDIPLVTVYSADEMEDALKSLEDRDVVLIDTAGKSASGDEYKKEIVSYIEKSGVDEILLAMSVVTGYNPSREIISNFSFLQDYKIVITKMDEVSVWGNVLNIVSCAKKPLTYLTMGQKVPDDIEQADIQKIVDNILGSVNI